MSQPSGPGNWSENPYNYYGSLKTYSTAQLLFDECHKNCVDFQFGAAVGEQDSQCIKNCQAKTHQAFDMYMRVQYNFSKKKSPWDYIDMSAYTGMDSEHGLNTANLYPESNEANLGHFDPNGGSRQNNFKAMEKNMKAYTGLRDAAFVLK